MKLVSAGYFSKPHGLKGHLVLFTDVDFDEKINAFFVETNGSQAPFFIEELTPNQKGYLVKLEGINNVDDAGKLKNKQVLADKKYIFIKQEFEFSGFTLIDSIKGKIGLIEDLAGSEENPLLVIKSGEKEILLPFQDELIEKVNKSKKELYYNAPEGLIDMYLEL